MDDLSDRLLDALSRLDQVAEELTADEAIGALDETAVQVFWKDWPPLGAWAGAVWRRINDDLSASVGDGEHDEGGEAG